MGWVVVILALAFLGLAPAQQSPLETAWALAAQGKRPEAVSVLRALLKSDPRNADAHLLLGSLLMEGGKRNDSIAELREGVRLQPASAEAHNALGEAYKTFGDPENAEPEFERAVQLDPRHAQAHLNLAELLLSRDDVSSAGRHLDQAIPLLGDKPDAAYARYLRAKVYSGVRDPARAAGELEKAVALAPDLAEAWSDLGEERRILGDDAGSLAAFRRAVSLNPDDAVAQTRLGSKLLDSGETHEAVEYLEAGVRLDPRNQTALNALQRALRQDGQTERADAVKQKLAELLRDKDREDQNLVAAMELNNRGAELESRGDVKGALEKYRAAARLQPQHVGIQVNLAVALLKLGNWNEGISQMRDALRRDPGNTQLEKALADAITQARRRGIVVPKQ